VVDKPAGCTSHDVVARARRQLGEKRVGHAGTLDPDATGVLVLGVGSATRLLRFVGELGKSYTGEVVFGTETSTLDAAGEVTATHDMTGLTLERVQAAAAALTGDLLQVPPMVSAIQVGGRRLHELAREGIEIEREPRPVTVRRFDVRATADPLVVAVEVDCSQGTYIRSLAADLGHALGGGAHLRALRRTAVGSFTVDEAVPLDELSVDRLMPVAAAVRELPSLTVVSAGVAAAIANGKVLDAPVLGATGEGPWAVLDADGGLLAVYERHRGSTVKPAVVLPASLPG
jgi:tRNA pseudouridine55 synthase